METKENASVALVHAKIAQNKRIKEDAERRRIADQTQRFSDYMAFWQPLVNELQQVSTVYPAVRVHIPDIHLSRPIRFTVNAEETFDLEKYADGSVSCKSRNNAYSCKAASKEELLPMILNKIAEKLS